MINPYQVGLFDRYHPKQTTISIRENHELMRLADVVPWRELIDVAQDIRNSHLFAKGQEQKTKVGKRCIRPSRNCTNSFLE